jgi:RNA polymerase sigma factor (sigma-70 family)
VKLKEFDLPTTTLAAARAGESWALEAFYRGCSAPAYTLIRRIVVGAAAEDLLHEAFVDAFRALPSFDGRAPLGIWFRAIAVRRCLMHLRSPWQRSRAWLREVPQRWNDGDGGPGDDAIGHDAPGASSDPGETIDLQRALAGLTPVTRLVVWLHDVEGYSHDEIGGLFASTASFSKSRLARGHARLRAALPPEPAAEAATCPCSIP